MMDKLLITGARGRIGSALARHWSSQQPVLLDREDGDFSQAEPRWMDRFAGIVTVVHLAADPDNQGPFESAGRDNILSVLNVLDACQRRGVQRLVFASSVWADHKVWQASEIMTWYSASKRAGEALVHAWSDQNQRPAVCLRLSLYDPGPSRAGALAQAARLDDAALVHHFNSALEWSEPRCETRYAIGKLA